MPTPHDLHVEVIGEGPPVLLVHSSGLSGRQWSRLAGRLSQQGFRVILPDLHGHGASPAWPAPTPLSYREDVVALASILRAEAPVHVVGHSYGGLIALLAALEAPDAVRSMTLFDPVAFGVLHARRDAAAHAELKSVALPWGSSEEDHERWLCTFVDYWGGRGAWASLKEQVRAEFRRVGWAIHQGVTTLVKDNTPASAYAELPFRFTFITGEHSPLAARTVVERLAKTIPGAKLHQVEGAGHMAPLSHAEKVNAHVLEAVSIR
jgi:pimeloyl-ACP methyl ester carboxylesterase